MPAGNLCGGQIAIKGLFFGNLGSMGSFVTTHWICAMGGIPS